MGQRRLGTVKSFSPVQGYGFIACEDVFSEYQRDTYFDKSQLPADGKHRLGQTVEFSVTANARGQPQARSIDWEPVEVIMPEPGDGRPVIDKDAPRHVNVDAADNLRKLLKMLHSGEQEGAVVTAIDLQGASNDGGDGRGTQDKIDYVTFVL